MAQELAHEILRQAKEQYAADRQEAANRSGAVLTLWSWRGKHHAQVNTRFEKQWNVRLTPRNELVVATYSCEFPGYSPLLAQHVAKTFLYQREDDALMVDRAEFAERCQAYDEAGPCHYLGYRHEKSRDAKCIAKQSRPPTQLSRLSIRMTKPLWTVLSWAVWRWKYANCQQRLLPGKNPAWYYSAFVLWTHHRSLNALMNCFICTCWQPSPRCNDCSTSTASIMTASLTSHCTHMCCCRHSFDESYELSQQLFFRRTTDQVFCDHLALDRYSPY